MQYPFRAKRSLPFGLPTIGVLANSPFCLLLVETCRPLYKTPYEIYRIDMDEKIPHLGRTHGRPNPLRKRSILGAEKCISSIVLQRVARVS